MTPNLERRGEGTPIVFVHGIGSRWQVFEAVLDQLAATHEVIAIDLPGFGSSPLGPDVVPGPYGYADWLETWLREQGIERPHLVGNSMGGGIALELGRRGVAASVTAFSPIGFWRAPGLRWTQAILGLLRVLARRLRPVVQVLSASTIGRVVVFGVLVGHPQRIPVAAARADAAALAGAPAFGAALRSFAGYRLRRADAPGELRRIPVTIAWGTRDLVLTWWTQSRRARTVLPGARHVSLPGSGHLPFGDDPARCARVIEETVRRDPAQVDWWWSRALSDQTRRWSWPWARCW